MKRLLVTFAFALVVATPSSGAIQYDFIQKNTTDDVVRPNSDLTARAIVDGENTRVEFLSGTIYPPGTYVVTTDGFRRIYFVDPSKGWYTEVNAAGISSALGSAGIRISNFKTETATLPDRPVIAGIETEHRRITMTYDISVTMKSMPLTQRVRTDIDVWSTDKFGALRADFVNRGMRTGQPDLDRIIESESSRVSGFPLRQLITTRTSYDMPARSNLNVPTSRTMTKEFWVTSIREETAKPSFFVIPATYRRSDQPDVPKAATQILTFDPATK